MQVTSTNTLVPSYTSVTTSTNSTDGGDFAAVMAQLNQTTSTATTQSTTSSLVTDATSSVNARPDLKTFMDKTGIDFNTATELVYGVVGSNVDTRNWSAIMTSSDPVTTARQATAQMYGSAPLPLQIQGDSRYLQVNDTYAKSGNFAIQTRQDATGSIQDSRLRLVDNHGMILRDAGGNAEQIQRNSWLFGFDTQQLNALIEPAKHLSASLSQTMASATGSGSVSTLNNSVTEASESPMTASITTETTEPSTAIAVTPSAAATAETTTATTATNTAETAASLSQQIADLAANLSNGIPTSMSSYLNSYTQLQALMAKMNDLQKTLAS